MTNDPILREHIVEGCEIGLQKLRTILENIDTSKIDVTDPKHVMNLANAFSGLTKAYCDLMRESRDTRTLVASVHEHITEVFRVSLAQRPELVAQCMDVLDRVCVEVAAEDDGRTKKLVAANKARYT